MVRSAAVKTVAALLLAVLATLGVASCSGETEPAADAGEVRQALLDAFGIDEFTQLPSDSWGFYIADVQVEGSRLVLTLQTDDAGIVDGSSRAAFSLIGGQFPDLKWVEAVDGAGNHLEQTSRSDVPLLNT